MPEPLPSISLLFMYSMARTVFGDTSYEQSSETLYRNVFSSGMLLAKDLVFSFSSLLFSMIFFTT